MASKQNKNRAHQASEKAANGAETSARPTERGRSLEVAQTIDPKGLSEAELLEILGPFPVLDGENRDHYTTIYQRSRLTVAPADILEEMWVRDVVDLSWEIFRLRRLKAKLIDGRTSEGIQYALKDLVDYEERESLLEGWINRKVMVMKRVDKLLESAGFDHETVLAETLSANLNDVERFDQMTMHAEDRRNSVIREIDRHREAVARRLREAVTDIEDAEFEDISAPSLRRVASGPQASNDEGTAATDEAEAA